MVKASIKSFSSTSTTPPLLINNTVHTDEGINNVDSFGGPTKDRTLGFSGLAQSGSSVRGFDTYSLLGAVNTDNLGRLNSLTLSGSSLTTTSAVKPDVLAPTFGSSSQIRTLNGFKIFSGDTAAPADLIFSGTVSDLGLGVNKVRVYDGSTYLGDATLSTTGKWSFNLKDLLNGSHAFSVRAVDNAGNESSQTGPAFTVYRDPGTLFAKVMTDTELGGVSYGGSTKDSTPTFTGSGVKGSTVEIWEGAKLLRKELLQTSGSFELTLQDSLSQGAHVLKVKLINGNVTESQNYSFTVDSIATGAISAVLLTNEKTGLVSNVTQGATTLGDLLEVRGSKEAWANIEVFDNGVYLGRAGNASSTQWSFKTTQPMDLGAHKITVEVTDLKGNKNSYEAKSFTVGLDGTTPQHAWSSDWGWGAVDVLDALQIATGIDYVNGAGVGRQEITKHNFDDAWREGYTGKGVRVAVIDTGVDMTNADLMPNFLKELCFDFVNSDTDATDDNGHGNFVLSQMAAANNGVGLTGAAYGAEYFAVKAMNRYGMGGIENLSKAIRYSVDNGADIINLSLGGAVVSPADSNFHSAVSYAKDHGVLIVAAAGNDAADRPFDPAILAKTYSNVIAVGSSQGYSKGTTAINDDVILSSDFSNKAGSGDAYGFVTAVGRQCTGYGLGGVGDIAIWSGTSMATPMVSAAAAIVWGAHQDYTAEQVRAVLIASTYNQVVI